MTFYLYSKPVESKRGGKVVGMLLKVEMEEKENDEGLRKTTVYKGNYHFNRLILMLSHQDTGDGWCFLESGRTEKDIIDFMNTWDKEEKK